MHQAANIAASPELSLALTRERPAWTWLEAVKRFVKRKPLGAAGAGILLVLLLVAVFAPLIARYDPIAQDVPNRLREPSAAYWFGTDVFGRDIYSRIVWGARISLYVGFVSVGICTVVGVLLGVLSGYLGGWFDLLLQRIVDAMMGFPSLIMALILVVGLGPSLNTVSVALAISFTPRMIRLARSSALSAREEQYVLAARAVGCSTLRIVLLYVIPNCMAPVFVLATGYLGSAIIAEASLSFLGLGIPPPNPSWGGMLQFGAKGFLEAAPWLTIFPGLALSLATFGFALLGDALRDVLDPRLQGSS